MAAVKIDLNLHLTVSLHGWTRNQTQIASLVQFFLPSSDKGKKPKTTQNPAGTYTLSLSLHASRQSNIAWTHQKPVGGQEGRIIGSLKQTESSWSESIWACAFEPDDWCLSWLRDWKEKGPRTVQKYLKKISQLKIWPVEWNMSEWNAWKAETGGRGSRKEEIEQKKEKGGGKSTKRNEKYIVPARGCKKISPIGFTKEMPSCPPAVISSFSEACPPGERREWLADQCCMGKKCDAFEALHSFLALITRGFPQPSSDINMYKVLDG